MFTRTADEIMALDPELAIIPVGSIEQHGPHLPIMTDWAIATELGRRVAEKMHAFQLPALPVSMLPFPSRLPRPPPLRRKYAITRISRIETPPPPARVAARLTPLLPVFPLPPPRLSVGEWASIPVGRGALKGREQRREAGGQQGQLQHGER